MNTPRIALATYSALPGLDADDAPLLDALAHRGVQAEAVVWDDPAVDWSVFDLVVIRNTWDYIDRHQEFLDWVERVSQVSTLANPASVVRWNTDKRYLMGLSQAGIPVVPTSFLDPEAHNEGRKIHARIPGRGQFVVKPTVSAGSKDTARYRSGDVDDRGAAVRLVRGMLREGRGVMIQPYLTSVDEAGETALIYVGGLFSHAVRKGAILKGFADPLAEPFMAEEMSPREATSAQRAVGDAVLAALPSLVPEPTVFPLLYVRVDLVDDDEGYPVVLEVEATEPSLFFAHAPGTLDRFADALVGRALAAARH